MMPPLIKQKHHCAQGQNRTQSQTLQIAHKPSAGRINSREIFNARFW